MPVSIGSRGGLQYMANVQYQNRNEALQTLISIRKHLDLPGKDSGTLVLTGRSKTKEFMQLTRKGDFRTFFTSKGRLDDTRDALRELLDKAGHGDTRAKLERYLNPDGHPR